jgi:hypothetical protein
MNFIITNIELYFRSQTLTLEVLNQRVKLVEKDNDTIIKSLKELVKLNKGIEQNQINFSTDIKNFTDTVSTEIKNLYWIVYFNLTVIIANSAILGYVGFYK